MSFLRSFEGHGYQRWGVSQRVAAGHVRCARGLDALLQIPHPFAVEVLLQLFVSAFEEGV